MRKERIGGEIQRRKERRKRYWKKERKIAARKRHTRKVWEEE